MQEKCSTKVKFALGDSAKEAPVLQELSYHRICSRFAIREESGEARSVLFSESKCGIRLFLCFVGAQSRIAQEIAQRARERHTASCREKYTRRFSQALQVSCAFS